MHRLRSAGYRFSLDDFGAGFSSLKYLKELVPDYLKIDGSFIPGIKTDPEQWIFVEMINDMAKRLHVLTIAECVEDEDTLKKLRQIGVPLGQGFYFGKPQPAPEILERNDVYRYLRDGALARKAFVHSLRNVLQSAELLDEGRDMVEAGEEIPEIGKHGENGARFNVGQPSDPDDHGGREDNTKKLHHSPIHRFGVRETDPPFCQEPVMSENPARHSARQHRDLPFKLIVQAFVQGQGAYGVAPIQDCERDQEHQAKDCAPRVVEKKKHQCAQQPEDGIDRRRDIALKKIDELSRERRTGDNLRSGNSLDFLFSDGAGGQIRVDSRKYPRVVALPEDPGSGVKKPDPEQQFKPNEIMLQ